MASPSTIAKCLALLQSVFPRDITAAMTEVYAVALADLSDEQCQRGTAAAIRECTFFPVPAELRKRAGLPAPNVDIHGTIAAIQSLGEYSFHGWRYPRIEHVRETLGAAAANAYGMVGSHRLYSDNETTRGIAERDFSEAYRDCVKDNPANGRPLLTDGVKAIGGMHPDLRAMLQADHPKLLT